MRKLPARQLSRRARSKPLQQSCNPYFLVMMMLPLKVRALIDALPSPNVA